MKHPVFPGPQQLPSNNLELISSKIAGITAVLDAESMSRGTVAGNRGLLSVRLEHFNDSKVCAKIRKCVILHPEFAPQSSVGEPELFIQILEGLQLRNGPLASDLVVQVCRIIICRWDVSVSRGWFFMS